MEMQHVRLQTRFERELLLTYRAHVSPGASVSRDVVVEVGTIRVTFAAQLTVVPR